MGTLLGGAIYHWLGGRNLFRIMAGMCLLSALVFFLLQHYVIKKGLRYSRFHEICDGPDKLGKYRIYSNKRPGCQHLFLRFHA